MFLCENMNHAGNCKEITNCAFAEQVHCYENEWNVFLLFSFDRSFSPLLQKWWLLFSFSEIRFWNGCPVFSENTLKTSVFLWEKCCWAGK